MGWLFIRLAQNSAVFPVASLALTSAPRLRSNSAMEVLELTTAVFKGEAPLDRISLGLVPRFRYSLTVDRSPRYMAVNRVEVNGLSWRGATAGARSAADESGPGG